MKKISHINSTLHRIGLVAVGTAIGQGAIFISTPLLARTHSPSEFGQLAILITITNIFSIIGCLRYDLAITTADQKALLPLSMLCTAIVLIWSLTPLPLLIPAVASKLPALPLPLSILIAAILGSSLYQLCASILISRQQFGRLATLRATQGTAFSLFSIIPGCGLLLGHVASFFTAVAAVVRKPRSRKPAEQGLLATARQYKQFPLYSTPGAIFDTLAYSMGIWVISWYFGSTQVGEYSQVQRLIGAPLLLLSLGISQVILRKLTELQQHGQALVPLLKKVFLYLASASLLLILSVSAFGKEILGIVLGKHWHMDTPLVTAATIAVCVRTTVSPLSNVLIVTNRIRLGSSWQLLYFISSCCILPLLARLLSFDHYILAYALHELTLYGVYLSIIYYVSKN